MRKCRFCSQEIEDAVRVCPHCGKDLIPQPKAEPPKTNIYGVVEKAGLDAPTTQVTVVDVNMPFGSMVVFMVKWALASIPAFFILAIPALILIALSSSCFVRR